MAFRAAALGNNGTTSTSATSFTIVVPAAAQVDDVAIAVMARPATAGSFTNDGGFTLLAGPDNNGTVLRSQVWAKTLTSADLGATVTFTSTNAGRLIGAMTVLSGVTLAGAVVGLVVDSTSGTSWLSPAVTTTRAGSDVVNLWVARHEGVPASTATMPARLTNDATATTATSSYNLTVQASHLTTPGAAGSYGGDTAAASSSSVENVYTIALPPVVGTSTVTGATAVATASSDPGTLSTGWTVRGVTARVNASVNPGVVSTTPSVVIAGVTAKVNALALPGVANPIAIVPVAAPSPVWPPDPYRDAVRNGGVTWLFSVAASRGGAPVAGATDLRPVGGSNIVDTSKPGVRRTLSLELAPEPGLYEALVPEGTRLKVTATATYLNRSSFSFPMGVFDVDSERLSEGGGGLSLTAPDKWSVIQRAQFMGPASSRRGIPVTDQIVTLIRGALGAAEEVAVKTTARDLVPALTWEKDRAQAIIDLANSIGAWVYFDADGVATIEDVRTVGAVADWLVDASPQGVLTSLDRERSRAVTRNIVVVTSSASAGALFPPQYVWDNDINSATYAGAGAGVGSTPPPAATAGPFGQVPYFYDTPVLNNVDSARKAGRSILARTVGLASQASLAQIPNPAVQALDVIDVLPPRQRYDIARVVERHVVDTVTHPLTVEGSPVQTIQGRSTRTDPYTEG